MLVTIVIPTLDAGPAFDEVLRACANQRLADPHEILVIDSGSSDGTATRARRWGARVHEIPNYEFGHRRTRNLAVELSEAEFVVFLTQDAQPLGHDWLSALLRPFGLSDRVGAVYGRQVPHPHCRPSVKRDIRESFRRLGPDSGVVLHGPGFICDGERTWEASFFSNVNSAVRRAVFKAVPFRDVEYAQDQAFAADPHAAGFLIAYAPLAAVLHSHDYPIRTYFARMVDEFHGLRSTLGHAPRVGLARHAGAALIGTLRDAASAALDREYTPAERVRGILSAPAYQVARRLATAVGRARSRRMAEHFSFDRRRRHAAAE